MKIINTVQLLREPLGTLFQPIYSGESIGRLQVLLPGDREGHFGCASLGAILYDNDVSWPPDRNTRAADLGNLVAVYEDEDRTLLIEALSNPLTFINTAWLGKVVVSAAVPDDITQVIAATLDNPEVLDEQEFFEVGDEL